MMSPTELDITRFVNEAAPMDYSASVAEIGQNAGPDTWRAACDDSDDWPLLQTDEQREAFRAFVRDSGGWSREEIAAWSDAELNALCIQWVAGDIRECGIRPGMTDGEWGEIQSQMEDGLIPSRIGQSIDGGWLFYIGS
jgi:hypothetical protein